MAHIKYTVKYFIFLCLCLNSLLAADDAQFISQQFVPATAKTGASYMVTITMKNNGTTTWTTGGANPYRLGSINNNIAWGTGRVELPSAQVLPGQTAVFNFKIVAPDTIGMQNFQWQMLQEGVQWFGNITPYTSINVIQSGNTFNKSTIDAKKFGIYFFSGYAALNNPGPNFLTTVSNMMENIGTETIRIVMSPSSDNTYHLNSSACIANFTLKGLAQRADFQAVLANPQFRTIMITAYDGVTSPNCVSKYLNPAFLTPTVIQQIQNEYKDLAQYLGTTYPDKKFIVAHWEGDNTVYTTSCINGDSCHARIGAFTKWINARTAGIHAAGVSNVFSCMEFNYRNGFDPGPLNLLHDALPNMNVDYLSYSSWGSTYATATNEADQFTSNIHSIRKIIATAGKDSTKLVIGEFGFNSVNRKVSRDKHIVLAQAISNLNIPHAIIWNMLDVDGSTVSPFGLYDPTATMTPEGQAYCYLWDGKACGNITDAGVTGLVSPTNSFCPGNISPVVSLKNFGNYELDDVIIRYTLDNGPVVSSPFSVSYGSGLLAGNSATLTLNPSVFSFGTHQLKLFSSLPNGKNDAVKTNDTLSITLNISCTTGISSNQTTDIEIYPVPSKDGIFYMKKNIQDNTLTELNIYDVVGNLVYGNSFLPTGNETRIDLSFLPPGVYVSRTNSGFTKRLIIL